MGAVAIERFQQAEKLFFENKGDFAKEIYASLTGESAQLAALSNMRLGEIANQNGKAVYARRLLLKAFRTCPTLAAMITPEDHPFHQYVYDGPKREKRVRACPLCGVKGAPYWSYIMVTNLDYQKRFNPVRTWKYCERCHHLYAAAYPLHPSGQAQEGKGMDNEYIKTKPALFAINSDILNGIKRAVQGRRLLEIGIGGGELLAVAQEMGFQAKGIDISYSAARQVEDRFGVDVTCADFDDYQPEEKFDILCMGDVIEHMANPKSAVGKARRLLGVGGILWISTPNFEGSFSRYYGHNDPMRRVAEHLNYFSYRSLTKILRSAGFEPLGYRVSKHYNGSMEIMARRQGTE